VRPTTARSTSGAGAGWTIRQLALRGDRATGEDLASDVTGELAAGSKSERVQRRRARNAWHSLLAAASIGGAWMTRLRAIGL